MAKAYQGLRALQFAPLKLGAAFRIASRAGGDEPIISSRERDLDPSALLHVAHSGRRRIRRVLYAGLQHLASGELNTLGVRPIPACWSSTTVCASPGPPRPFCAADARLLRRYGHRTRRSLPRAAIGTLRTYRRSGHWTGIGVQEHIHTARSTLRRAVRFSGDCLARSHRPQTHRQALV